MRRVVLSAPKLVGSFHTASWVLWKNWMLGRLMNISKLLVIGAFVFGGALFAAPQNVDGEHKVAAAPAGAELSLEDIMDVAGEGIDQHFHRHYYHCTAYAEGHGHDWGFDYRDVHYNHAYWGAVRKCERATGHHCHDVHCHVD